MLFDGVTVLRLANLLSLIDYFITLTLNRQKRLITLVLTQLKYTDYLSLQDSVLFSPITTALSLQNTFRFQCAHLIMSQGVSKSVRSEATAEFYLLSLVTLAKCVLLQEFPIFSQPSGLGFKFSSLILFDRQSVSCCPHSRPILCDIDKPFGEANSEKWEGSNDGQHQTTI